MCTHNICFHVEIRKKIFTWYPLLSWVVYMYLSSLISPHHSPEGSPVIVELPAESGARRPWLNYEDTPTNLDLFWWSTLHFTTYLEYTYSALTLKALSAADNLFFFWGGAWRGVGGGQKNKVWHSMWIVCRAGNLYGMPSLIFYKEYTWRLGCPKF